MGKALYRKYRPTKLSDVVGQEATVTALENALKKQTFSHSYLFIGPRGCGKTSVARIFAHAVNQFDYQLEDSYVDIIEIDAASNTGVDNIRELREKAVVAPTQGKYKVYIIDEVHMLSKSAFNALLKIMEEPPRHVIFIMATTDAQKVPATITSRAQTFTFKLAAPEVMSAHLRKIADAEKLKLTDGAINIITHRGGGSFRDSISLLDQISNLSNGEITAEIVEKALGLPQDQVLSALLTAYTEVDDVKITTLLKDLINTGIKPEIIATELISRIIKEPKRELLPLLKKLPDVYGQFTEAKLLVAMLERPADNPATPPDPRPAIKKAAPHPAVSTPRPAQPPATPPESPAPEAPAPSADNSDFISAVSSASSGIANIINKCRCDIQADAIHIYPTSKTYHMILSTSANQDILMKAAGSKKLVIHDVSEAPASSQFSQISDIMGTVEEVVNTDGDPFSE